MRDYLSGSGLVWVALGFSILVALNLITLALGPAQVLANLATRPWGAFVSVFVFDSWGTAGGLVGVVVLFTPLLFGVPRAQRARLSAFFLAASVIVGVTANVLWTDLYNDTGFIGSGSSSIAFAAQAIIFTLSIFGLVSLVRGRSLSYDPETRAMRQFFTVVYITLILSTLYLVLVLQPIFTPTTLYNWRVHEIGFIMGIGATFLYQAAPGGLTINLVPSSRPNQPK